MNGPTWFIRNRKHNKTQKHLSSSRQPTTRHYSTRIYHGQSTNSGLKFRAMTHFRKYFRTLPSSLSEKTKTYGKWSSEQNYHQIQTNLKVTSTFTLPQTIHMNCKKHLRTWLLYYNRSNNGLTPYHSGSQTYPRLCFPLPYFCCNPTSFQDVHRDLPDSLNRPTCNWRGSEHDFRKLAIATQRIWKNILYLEKKNRSPPIHMIKRSTHFGWTISPPLPR